MLMGSSRPGSGRVRLLGAGVDVPEVPVAEMDQDLATSGSRHELLRLSPGVAERAVLRQQHRWMVQAVRIQGTRSACYYSIFRMTAISAPSAGREEGCR